MMRRVRWQDCRDPQGPRRTLLPKPPACCDTQSTPKDSLFTTRQSSLETQATESTNKNHHVLHSLFYDLLLLLFSRLATSDSCIPIL